jgi:hypothetical protein
MIFPLGVSNQTFYAFLLSPVRAIHVCVVPFTLSSSLISLPVLELLIFKFCLAGPNVTVPTLPKYPYGVPYRRSSKTLFHTQTKLYCSMIFKYKIL